jgi:hypothetical protein
MTCSNSSLDHYWVVYRLFIGTCASLEIFHIACIIFVVLVVSLFFLFHLGLRNFQKY